MADETSQNSKLPVEMTPGEDGTKVPLTGESPPTVEEAKYIANSNGDAKIDVGTVPTFSGLTKEELMKYSDDPFWVRLRWFLFALFWLGWLAMLAMAIVIIVRAPGCEPPPVRLWVEEGAIYQVDTSSLPQHAELIVQINSLGVSSVYLQSLIDENDFSMSNYDADALIQGLVEAGKRVITDLPAKISPENVLFDNATSAGIVDSSGNFIYTNANLSSTLVQYALGTWISRGVKGFLISDSLDASQQIFKEDLNSLIKEMGGAVGSDIVDMRDHAEDTKGPSQFRDFLEDRSGNWSYYKFQPSYNVSSQLSNYQVRLMNIAMFIFEGTPILKSFAMNGMTNSSARLISELSTFRTYDGVKFGVVNFVNTTSDDLIGFTRVQKGTPAYAVALNFGLEPETISFEGTPNIADDGNVQLDSEKDSLNDENDIRRKVELNNVPLKPFEGLVIQFVANFDKE